MWVDQKFVHVISPNVYRTLSESLDSFKWFSYAGGWNYAFNGFDRFVVIYLGSLAMYFVAKNLKKKFVKAFWWHHFSILILLFFKIRYK